MNERPRCFSPLPEGSRLRSKSLNPEILKGLEAFIFDFDGTLAELNIDFDFMRTTLLNLSREYGIEDQSLKNLLILELIETVKNQLEKKNPRKALNFFKEAYLLVEEIETKAAHEGALLDGTVSLLTELKRRGKVVGIISRNCHAALRCVFPRMENYCDVVLSRNETTHVKPHLGHLLETLRLLNAGPNEAVMIGDHPLDIHLGKKVGTYTIGVLTGYSDEETMIASGADMILSRAAELIDLLR